MTINKLPDFLIVGAQKCGTTTLYDVLKLHPEISMSDVKEVNYFTSETKYRKGLNFYAQHWTPDDKAKILGEASPGYMVYPGVAEKIKKDLGDVKIIMILRDPVKRAVSQYWDNRRQLSENETFEQVLERYLQPNYDPKSKGYFSRGVYIKYLEKYWSLFGEENVHVLTLEHLIKNYKEALLELFDFLGVTIQQDLLIQKKQSNGAMIWDNRIYNFFLEKPELVRFLPKRGKRILNFGKKIKYTYPQPNQDVIEKLIDFYSQWNKELEQKTNLDLSPWLTKRLY